MRFLVSIVTFYMLLMAVMPAFPSLSVGEEICCSGESCAEKEAGANETTTDCDVCNPLFACSCYFGFYIPSHSIKIETALNLISNHSVFKVSVPAQLSFTVWQPPKNHA